MTEALARIEDLHHSFGGVPALRGFSTTIAPGIITGLIGPDAAGKTTLLRLLAGLLRPEHGRITVLGHDMVRMPPARTPPSAICPSASAFMKT